MGPGGPGSGWPLAGTLLVAVAASMVAGGEDCLWYVDRNGSWHPGFDCEFFTFCCGTCQQRYCCRDPLRLLTERQQRHCLAFSGCWDSYWYWYWVPGSWHWYWVLVLGFGCWTLVLGTDTGHCTLGDGCCGLVTGTGCWALVTPTGCWSLGEGTGTGHWHCVPGTAAGWAMLLSADSSAGHCHWALVLGTGRCHWVLGTGHRALSVGAGWGCVLRVPPWPCSPRPGVPQPQDHRGHRLSRGAFHRHRHHHRLLLHVLLLLPVPAPAALPHTPARPGNSPVQLPPRSSPSSLPRGPQSRPYTSPAWLHPRGHVPPARPCRPVPHVPLRAPRLQPHSTATLRPGAAQLPWSMSPRGDPRTRRRPAGPGWGPQGPPLAPGGCLSQRWIGLFPAILR